jgi:hypothetical protein
MGTNSLGTSCLGTNWLGIYSRGQPCWPSTRPLPYPFKIEPEYILPGYLQPGTYSLETTLQEGDGPTLSVQNTAWVPTAWVPTVGVPTAWGYLQPCRMGTTLTYPFRIQPGYLLPGCLLWGYQQPGGIYNPAGWGRPYLIRSEYGTKSLRVKVTLS